MADDCEGGKYLAVFNASDEKGSVEFGLEELEGLSADSKATELWSGESISFGNTFAVDVPAHGAKVFRV